MTQNPNLFLSIGKQVKDEYGRIIGRVTSFAVIQTVELIQYIWSKATADS